MNNSAASLGLKLAEKLRKDAEIIQQAENQSLKSIEIAQARLEQHLKQLLIDVSNITTAATNHINAVKQLTQDLSQSLTSDQIQAIQSLTPILSKLMETSQALANLSKINGALSSHKTTLDKAISDQTQALDATIQIQTSAIQKLVKLLLLYLLSASLAVALLIPLISWVMTPKALWNQPTQLKTYEHVQFKVLISDDWTQCEMDDKTTKPCKKMED